MAERQSISDLLARIKRIRLSGEMLVRIALGILLVVLLALMLPRAESLQLEYKVGAIWAQKDLIAPFSFPILREEKEYAKDVEEARKNVYEVFERDTQAVTLYAAKLDQFIDRLNEALALRAEMRKALRLRIPLASDDSARFGRVAAALDIPFTEKEWDGLAGLAAHNRLHDLENLLLTAGRGFLAAGIIDRPRNSIARSEIAVRRGTIEDIVPVDRLLDQNDVVVLLEQQLETYYGGASATASIVFKIGITHLTPNVRYSAAGTDQAIAAAIDAVPRTTGFVQENERIISKHERITPESRQKLDSFQRARLDRGTAAGTPLQFIGNLLHVALALVLFVIYLSLFRKRIVGNIRRLNLIAFLFLLIGFLAYLTRELDVAAPIEYLIVVPAASMLLTIIFDSRVGFYGTVTMAMIVAGIRGNDYSVALAALVAGALAVFSVRDMKIRSQIFRSLVFVFLGYGLVVVGLGLERSESISVIVEQVLFCLANAVVSPVLTYGLLIFLERVFKVTTDLTLIELAQFNHPLLRLLAEKAPGTYHHSMTMASLTEAAAAAVGANEVLARVAAYFHDVGKILKPTYFVENQRTTRSRHDKLSPRMSSLIIAAHVKDGVALAQEYGLPEEVIEFIPMHHGTTRIDYFYSKALKLAQQDPDETKVDEINEGDYRYPGPKPQTKETGIMMLADAVEAAVRTVDEPAPQRLQDIIDDIIKRRFEEGELDECPLTLKDLTKIKTAFLGVLVGVYHTRVKYPEQPKKPARRQRPMEPPAPPPGEVPPSEPQNPLQPSLDRTAGEIDKQ
jgi:putative nucleotidyltransferase with HDIG domain